MVYIVMGVSGCGKSTIGKMLAERLAITFHDADDYHSQKNVNKMMNLIPLNDEDRNPWLIDLASQITKWNKGKGAVLACSALKEKDRQILTGDGTEKVVFVYLKGDRDIILNRMRSRENHFFPPALLETQLSALQVPLDAITIQIDKTPEELCSAIIDELVRNGFT